MLIMSFGVPMAPIQPVAVESTATPYLATNGRGPQRLPLPPRRRHSGWRWTGATVLLVLGALLIMTTVIARFARDEITDTATYVDTVAPLASDPAVQNAVADRVSTEIITRINVPNLINELAAATRLPNAPAVATVIAGPVNGYVQDFVRGKVLQFVQSDEFRKLWVNANRLAHGQVSAVLTGEGSDVVKTSGDQVLLELGPVIAAVKRNLVSSGFSVANAIPTVSAQIPIMRIQNLPRIQGYVRLLETLATWLPLATLVLLVGAIALAPNRRRAALIGSLIVALLMVVVLIALGVFRNTYQNSVANQGLNVPAALSLYDTLLRFLVRAVVALLVVGLVAAVWLWLAGPGVAGRFLRRWIGRGERALAEGLDRTSLRLGGTRRFAARFGTLVIAVLGAVAFWYFLLAPSVGRAAWLAAIIVVLMIVRGILVRTGAGAGAGAGAGTAAPVPA